ncbi:uncharacterized protein LOC127751449 [Frankliniella occidentalis]|uniref:Uncharacterized protein LOC127751449 n=1 Tax=Frankliniella occidentalis TaxID=133901 RepID=A0A9C6X893_FRAOC|nr:uncharacterized protein LOC127751449 [Frankliniella occidentalis]
MYVFDRSNEIMMCRPCSARVKWERSVVPQHCSSEIHKKNKEKEVTKKRQESIPGSFDRARKAKIDKETFIKPIMHAFVKANIPLTSLTTKIFENGFKTTCLVVRTFRTRRWLREHYLPEIKRDYDADLIKYAERKKNSYID